MTRTAISLAAALLTALVFAVLPRVGREDGTPRTSSVPSSAAAERGGSTAAATARTFDSVRREAVALAEEGRLADAIALATEALRLGEKSFGKDRRVTRQALDRLANTIERWHVEID